MGSVFLDLKSHISYTIKVPNGGEALVNIYTLVTLWFFQMLWQKTSDDVLVM